MFLSFSLLSFFLLLGLFKVDRLVRLRHFLIAFELRRPNTPQLSLSLFPLKAVCKPALAVFELHLFTNRRIPELVDDPAVLSVSVGQDQLAH